ncbi:hypothetical protein YERSI8AC_280158 [Enterobacterales bacterium 8AC]|nr:hypothetical protein YERSI8AC_280158 [Enterobacterales bacterium 8AC]
MLLPFIDCAGPHPTLFGNGFGGFAGLVPLLHALGSCPFHRVIGDFYRRGNMPGLPFQHTLAGALKVVAGFKRFCLGVLTLGFLHQPRQFIRIDGIDSDLVINIITVTALDGLFWFGMQRIAADVAVLRKKGMRIATAEIPVWDNLTATLRPVPVYRCG